MPCILINDGYTLQLETKPVGPYPAIKYRCRPALYAEVMEYQYQRDLVNGREAAKPTAEFVAKHLVSWDIQNAKGEIVPVSLENVRCLPHGIIGQMVDGVTGYVEQAESDLKNSVGV